MSESLTREEWVRRFAARIRDVAGFNEAEAMSAAEAAAIEHEEYQRAHGGTIDWLKPEDEADDEMSYWSDDDEGQ